MVGEYKVFCHAIVCISVVMLFKFPRAFGFRLGRSESLWRRGYAITKLSQSRTQYIIILIQTLLLPWPKRHHYTSKKD